MRSLKVEGMSCKHCAMAVEKALQQVQGVANPQVDPDKGEVCFDEIGAVDINAVNTAIEKAGYKVG